MAEEMEIGYRTCQQVLMKEFGMHCVAAKFVPRILTAPSHTSVLTQQVLAKYKMAVIPHHPLIWHPVTSSYEIEAERKQFLYH
jgi:putative NIF3 family GTP cyclohydrolase 1 type 2